MSIWYCSKCDIDVNEQYCPSCNKDSEGFTMDARIKIRSMSEIYAPGIKSPVRKRDISFRKSRLFLRDLLS